MNQSNAKHKNSNLVWSPPIAVEKLMNNKSSIPSVPGVYAFTIDTGPITKSVATLYIGKADNLRGRLSGYLRHPSSTGLMGKKYPDQFNSSLRHAGKSQLWVHMASALASTGGRSANLYVRWVKQASPKALEDSLILELQPAFNSIGLG